MRSLLPVRLKPTITFPEGPPSDGLELKRLFLGKKDKSMKDLHFADHKVFYKVGMMHKLVRVNHLQ
jgi:hypothetical protein